MQNEEVDALIDELWPELERAEDGMVRRFKTERSFLQRFREKYPYFVVADFLKELKGEFSPELQGLVCGYHRYWSEGSSDESLHELNAQRARIHKAWLAERDTASRLHRSGKREDIEVVLATQFLEGETAWKTQQDGVFFYLCENTITFGIPVETVLEAMRKATSYQTN